MNQTSGAQMFMLMALIETQPTGHAGAKEMLIFAKLNSEVLLT